MTTSIPSLLQVTRAFPASIEHVFPSSLSDQHDGHEQIELAQTWLQPPLFPSKQLALTIDGTTENNAERG
jgi:hypothetical protein